MKKIALIANRNNILPFIFESAERHGLELFHFKNKNEASLSHFLSVVKEIDIDFFNDPTETINTIASYVKKYHLEGIFTLREEAIPLVCEVAKQCSLPTNTTKAAINCRNKLSMRELFLEHGLNVPKFLDINTQSYQQISQQLGSHFIIKPKGGLASSGVCLIDSEESFNNHLNTLKEISDSDFSFTKDKVNGGFAGIIAEEFIEGEEYVVESFSVDSKVYPLSIGYKGCAQGPFFEESVYISLDDHNSDKARELIEQTQHAVKALGITMGPSHTELRFKDDKAYVLEVGARIGGSGVSHFIVEKSTGLDFLGLQMRQSVGEKISEQDLDFAIKKSVSNYIIPIGGHGIYSHLSGVDLVESHADTFKVFELLKKGDVVEPYPKFTGFPGFIFSAHDNYETALSYQNFLRKNISTVFEGQ